jgi:hypothetical protein
VTDIPLALVLINLYDTIASDSFNQVILVMEKQCVYSSVEENFFLKQILCFKGNITHNFWTYDADIFFQISSIVNYVKSKHQNSVPENHCYFGIRKMLRAILFSYLDSKFLPQQSDYDFKGLLQVLNEVYVSQDMT